MSGDKIKVGSLSESDITADLALLVDGTNVDNIVYSAQADGDVLELTINDGMGGERKARLTVTEL